MSEPPSLDPGLTLLSPIGAGGIADVWLGEWLGAQVAVKVLRRSDHVGLRRRFLREGQLLSRLSHPGLIRCQAVIEGPQPALVLDLLKGEALDRRIRRGAIDVATVLRYADELLDILGFLHGHGIVHRDVKASNIWCSVEGGVVLMDLGLAADAADPLTTTLGEVVGTHAYMSPEQIAGAEIDLRCDLYSLGITLYEALVGSRPYQARGLAGYLQAHRSGRATPLSERLPMIPRRLSSLVERLMARDPASRPASAAVARAMLQSEPGPAGGLQRPRTVGREAVRGAIEAVLDGGGPLILTGEGGSGLGAMAGLAVRLAEGEGKERLRVRCAARLSRAGLVEALAREVEDALEGAPQGEAAVWAALDLLAGEGGLFVLFEDIDLLSPDALGLAASIAEDPRIAFVATSAGPVTLPRARTLRLRALSPEETRQLVAGMLGTAAVPPGLDLALHAAGGGQPAWIIELLRDACQRGAVRSAGVDDAGQPRWSWDAATALTPSTDATERLRKGLAAQSPATRRLLEVLAVAGAAMPLRVLVAAAQVDPSGLDLGPALRAGLATRRTGREEEWIELRRGVLGPVIAGTLTVEERRATHQALAEATLGWSERVARLHRALASVSPEDHRMLVSYARRLVEEDRAGEALPVLDRLTALADAATSGLDARIALVRAEALLGEGRSAAARGPLQASRSIARELGDARLAAEGVLVESEITLASGGRLSEGQQNGLLQELRGPHAVRARLAIAELRRRGADAAGAAEEVSAAAELLSTLPETAARRAAEARVQLTLAELVLLQGDPEGSATLAGAASPVGEGGRAWRWLCQMDAALARGRLAEAVELGRQRASVRRPWVSLGLLELEIALGDLAAATTLLRENVELGTAASLWPWRRRYLRSVALTRLAAQDRPAALDALLAGAEAADIAGDLCEQALHAGIAALLTGREAGVAEAMDRLTSAGVPRLQATLLAHGARFTGDPEVLVAAELAARVSGERLLLLSILAALRGPGARAEAATICEEALDGLYGPERLRFEARPEVRWALGEPSVRGRDTSG